MPRLANRPKGSQGTWEMHSSRCRAFPLQLALAAAPLRLWQCPRREQAPPTVGRNLAQLRSPLVRTGSLSWTRTSSLLGLFTQYFILFYFISFFCFVFPLIRVLKATLFMGSAIALRRASQ